MYFRNTIILMTSNVGAESAKRSKAIGFGNSEGDIDYEKMRELIMDEAKKTFRPEFMNRLDDLIGSGRPCGHPDRSVQVIG